MKRFFILILKFGYDTARFINFLIKLIYCGKSLSNPIKKKCSGTLVVLANGPSLSEIIPLLTTSDELKNTDYIVVNFFAFEDVFFQIKPKYYCLADPMFIKEDPHRKERVLKFFKILQNEIDWDISIYVPDKNFCDKFLSYSQITNKYIHCIPLNNIEYRGYDFLRYFFYKKGLSMPAPQNVTIVAIYAGLNMNYSDVRLYGADHTFFDSICVNDQNQLCNRDKHFYDKEVELKPIINNGILWKVADYFLAMSIVFRSHDILNDYAKYLNAKIVNYTKGSMIDSYERKTY
ncbi:MAG: hypothetical protein LBE13_09850 [Bacteroidales bacterium]|jgi:hypothetical protein|nr:hypothetical protein [Bacteroidales bacterium]